MEFKSGSFLRPLPISFKGVRGQTEKFPTQINERINERTNEQTNERSENERINSTDPTPKNFARSPVVSGTFRNLCSVMTMTDHLTQLVREITKSVLLIFTIIIKGLRERDKMFAVRIAGRCSSASLRSLSTFSVQNSSKSVGRFPGKRCNRYFQTETKAWRSWEGTTKAPGITGKLM